MSVRITLACDAEGCGERHEPNLRVGPYDELEFQVGSSKKEWAVESVFCPLPPGWRIEGDRLFCPAHVGAPND